MAVRAGTTITFRLAGRGNTAPGIQPTQNLTDELRRAGFAGSAYSYVGHVWGVVRLPRDYNSLDEARADVSRATSAAGYGPIPNNQRNPYSINPNFSVTSPKWQVDDLGSGALVVLPYHRDALNIPPKVSLPTFPNKPKPAPSAPQTPPSTQLPPVTQPPPAAVTPGSYSQYKQADGSYRFPDGTVLRFSPGLGQWVRIAPGGGDRVLGYDLESALDVTAKEINDRVLRGALDARQAFTMAQPNQAQILANTTFVSAPAQQIAPAFDGSALLARLGGSTVIAGQQVPTAALIVAGVVVAYLLVSK